MKVDNHETHAGLKISRWDPRYGGAFIRLNEAWIKKFFVLEKTDLKYLHDPIKNIISPGGDIVFLIHGDRVVGTCALVPHEPGVYELAKMAVEQSERGRGLGNVLMEAVIECARDKAAVKIFLSPTPS